MSIATPLINNTEDNILRTIEIYSKQGRLHHLYEEYQKKYGKDLNCNLLIPYLFNKKIYKLYIINHPKDAERLTNNHIKKMPNLKPFLMDSIISTTDVNHWREQRNEFSDAFSVYDELEKNISISCLRADYCKDLLWEMSNDGINEININEFFLNETMAQLQLAMFGLNENFQRETNYKIRKAFSNFDNVYGKKYIKKLYKELPKSKGPLSKVLNERNCSKSEKFGNSTIFTFAGHDTTGHTLSWLIYELCKNSEYQNRLQNEVDIFWIEQGDKEIKYNDLKRLKFMTLCIQETLRLWPALTNGTYRELVKDDYITDKYGNKLYLKKGTWIQIPNWSRHRNPDLWGDDASIFNPDRNFLEDEIWDNEFLAPFNPYSERFSPFTFTPRDCIGKNFAQIEMRIILLYLLKQFNFNLTKKQLDMNLDLISYNSFTLGPRNIYNKNLEDNTLGLYVYVNKRLSDNRCKL